MAQIIKRPKTKDTYLIRIYRGKDPETKKRTFVNVTVHGSRKDAETKRNEILFELDQGTYVEPNKMTIAQYLNDWFNKVAKARLRERTLLVYEDHIRRYIVPYIGAIRLSDLQPIEIQGLYQSLQNKKLSGYTIRHTHAVLSSALEQAVKWKMLARNPAKLVDTPKQGRREMKSLTPEEAHRFLAALPQDQYGLALELALVTGCRPSEYLGIKWSDLDEVNSTVTIQRSVVWRHRGSGWYFAETKTGASRRLIPLPAFIMKALKAHRSAQRQFILKSKKPYEKNDLVFATWKGTPLMQANLVNRYFKPALKAAGLPDSFRLYDLRHSCATLLLAAGEHPKVVAERLGHAGIAVTLDTYSHVLPSMQRAASDKLEAILRRK